MISATRIQVYGHVVMDPINPDPDDITIDSIAHSLSNQCRFAGHTNKFYSVAEHSIHVSNSVPQEDALWGLLHDASEAYLVDFPSPLKYSIFGKSYRAVESHLMEVICEKFGLPYDMPESVVRADIALLGTEVRDLLNSGPEDELWGPWLTEPPISYSLSDPLNPEAAKRYFLGLFYELTT